MTKKIQKKIDNIIFLKQQIDNWKEKTEEEISDLINLFEKVPRDEVSKYFYSYLNDNNFAKILLDIAETYSDNEKITLNIISSLSNMILRYKLEETEAIYEFILKNSTKKKMAGYVAMYLPSLKGFENYPNKWEYFMSMRKMSPKKVAHSILVYMIRNNIKTIPQEHKKDVIEFLQSQHDLANNEGGKKYYLSLINEIDV